MKWFAKIFAGMLVTVIIITVTWYAISRIIASFQSPELIIVNNQKDTPNKRDSIKLATFNIGHARGGKINAENWRGPAKKVIEKRLSGIAAQIVNSSVDILVLNEVDFDAPWSRGVDQAVYIARTADFKYLVKQKNYDLSMPFVRVSAGNAIACRFPVKEVRYIDLPALSSKEDFFLGSRNAVLALVETPIGDVRVLAAHLDYRNEEVRVESAWVLRQVVLEDETPIVVSGDFNSTLPGLHGYEKTPSGSNAMEVMLSGGLGSAVVAGKVSEKTFPSSAPDRIIDWILTSPNLKQSQRTVYPSLLSDHLMLTTVISPN